MFLLSMLPMQQNINQCIDRKQKKISSHFLKSATINGLDNFIHVSLSLSKRKRGRVASCDCFSDDKVQLFLNCTDNSSQIGTRVFARKLFLSSLLGSPRLK